MGRILFWLRKKKGLRKKDVGSVALSASSMNSVRSTELCREKRRWMRYLQFYVI